MNRPASSDTATYGAERYYTCREFEALHTIVLSNILDHPAFLHQPRNRRQRIGSEALIAVSPIIAYSPALRFLAANVRISPNQHFPPLDSETIHRSNCQRRRRTCSKLSA